jgi:Protein of unknown function (DUF2752)
VTDQSWQGAADGSPLPPPARHGAHRLYSALGSGAILVGALTYIGLADPHSSQSVYPQCPFKAITGLNCPFCGGLRMTYDLLHGDLAASINDNVFALIGIPLLAAWFVIRRRLGLPPRVVPVLVTVMIASFAWAVVRNLPGFPLVPTVLGG